MATSTKTRKPLPIQTIAGQIAIAEHGLRAGSPLSAEDRAALAQYLQNLKRAQAKGRR